MNKYIVYWVIAQTITTPISREKDEFGFLPAWNLVETQVDTLSREFTDIDEAFKWYVKVEQRRRDDFPCHTDPEDNFSRYIEPRTLPCNPERVIRKVWVGGSLTPKPEK